MLMMTPNHPNIEKADGVVLVILATGAEHKYIIEIRDGEQEAS